ncbi:PTS glucose transporter subunit IIBC [Candidatus Epulonipiscium fishelsonii]|uniref:PTS glucose transporter subunit IIBC n=1 Tax=Candidatus Epulonipiscium fishelsonii TaxID=77094 RepID=A0ACC8XFH3_9FIRM|nr:PTS glucose transporter subunit IIBC [Epulopiscium sp. SCG-B05WGA-EpuloA1]ONI42115.1 PTS glucose transporter subunit IIBC [Epulopiscium sp. SCG-B11WGA-EpuloA1]
MSFLQKLGKSLMLPVACLPAVGILMGIGYWIDPVGWGTNNLLALLLIKAGGILIDNMSILFVIAVAVGMADDGDASAALGGIVSWLTVQTMLSPAVVSTIVSAEANPAFGKINNQFIGILCGLIAATCYNKFKGVKFPEFLGFFSGKRCVAIVTSITTLLVCIPLFFTWPIIYTGLVDFGAAIVSTGAVGAGIYGFLNRMLIPVGLHHALNSVFWGNIEGGVLGQTGMYMAGFFPMMMFGLPGAALAMVHCSKPENRKVTIGILSSAALCSFFTGITEPLEFMFMFLAPPLYFIHSVLTGISCFVIALLPTRAGFDFSAGLVDYILSFNAPFALNPILLIPVGLVFFVVYYVIFRFAILKFNFKTPGREDAVSSQVKDFATMAATILEGLGGKENVHTSANCITRLRIEVTDPSLVDEDKIKSTGVPGVLRPSKNGIQIIVGTQVQQVADELKKLV